MATNLRLRDVQEGDLLDIDGHRATVTCAMVLDDDAILILDDGRGRQTTITGGPSQAVRLVARQLHNTIAGAAPSIVPAA